MATELFYKNFMGMASKAYKKALGSELKKIGVKYEDLIISSRPAVAEALELADPKVMEGRMRRLKRASDLSFKTKNLLDYAPETAPEPFDFEFYDQVKKIEARDEEYELLDLHKK